MEYQHARHLAESICHQLIPYCNKIKICGSVRRKQVECRDIDIVVLPKTKPFKDIFGMITHHERDTGFITTINKWHKIKGDPTGKYTQRLYQGHKLEIAIAQPENFGNLVLIRTGNADFSHLIMKIALKRGFNQKDGFLYRDDKLIPIPDEQLYFETLGIPFVQPEKRDANAFK